MARASDCVADRIRLAIPQATEWQCSGNQINAGVDLCGGALRKRAFVHGDLGEGEGEGDGVLRRAPKADP